MSRSWNKAGLYLYLGESALAVTRLAGRWRPQVVARTLITFSPGDSAAVLPAFESWLTSNPGPAREALHLTLAHVHVPLLVLPWSQDNVRDDFRRALVAGLLEKQLQKNAGEYEVAFGPARFGQPQLAACIARRQQQEWQALADRQRLILQSIRPLLASVWDGFHARFARGTGRLVLVEESRMLTAFYAAGTLQRIAVRPADRAAVHAVLQVEEGEVHLFAPDELAELASGNSRPLVLHDAGGQRLGHPYACGLCGVY